MMFLGASKLKKTLRMHCSANLSQYMKQKLRIIIFAIALLERKPKGVLGFECWTRGPGGEVVPKGLKNFTKVRLKFYF